MRRGMLLLIEWTVVDMRCVGFNTEAMAGVVYCVFF